MELYLLFLFLPLAFLSGWWIGRRKPGGDEPDCPDLSANYFKGLNFLLNEQPDKAIDVFVKMLEVNSETVETHLALGNLFRRRGEGERAIRIHQNLIARPTLSRQQRELALFELGQDYWRAGLLGRAESILLELVEQGGSNRQGALERLLDIYQQEKDWQKAIDAVRQLDHLGARAWRPLAAQFYCELAEAARARSDFKAALKLLKQAHGADRSCVRASLLQGAIEQQQGNHKAAIKALQQVEQQDPALLPEVAAPVLESYRALGKLDQAGQYLGHLLTAYASSSVLLAEVDVLERQQGKEAAEERIIEFLRKRPSVRGLLRLIELQLADAEGEAREDMRILQELLKRVLQEKAAYRCTNCGFEAKSLKWHCPGCKRWNTIRPVLGVVGE